MGFIRFLTIAYHNLLEIKGSVVVVVVVVIVIVVATKIVRPISPRQSSPYRSILEKSRQSIYTLQYPLLTCIRREKRKHENKWAKAQIKPLPGYKLEISYSDTC
jgi:hypothetical protein